jgi:hypothetical protein
VKARRNTYGSCQSLPWGTPVGYFTGAIKNENEVFERNRNDFPKVSFTLDVI